MKPDRAGMSIQETGALASLASTVVIYAIFFACTASGVVQGSDQVGLFIGLVVAQIAALICIHIALAIRRGTRSGRTRCRSSSSARSATPTSC